MKKVKALYGDAKAHAQKGYEVASKHVKKSIRLEILFLIAVAFLAALLGGFAVKNLAISAGVGENIYVSYEEGEQNLQNSWLDTINRITNIEQRQVIEIGRAHA